MSAHTLLTGAVTIGFLASLAACSNPVEPPVADPPAVPSRICGYTLGLVRGDGDQANLYQLRELGEAGAAQVGPRILCPLIGG